MRGFGLRAPLTARLDAVKSFGGARERIGCCRLGNGGEGLDYTPGGFASRRGAGVSIIGSLFHGKPW